MKQSYSMRGICVIVCLYISISFSSCIPNKWLTGSIPATCIPSDYKQTTLLIPAFEYTEITQKNREKKRILKYTNRHLNKLNRKLAKRWSRYKYPFQIAKYRQIDSLYPDKEKYRYIVDRFATFRYKPMDNVSYATYLYYFQDRKTDKTYQEMKIYSSIFWKTTRVIIQKLNKGVRQPALASSSQPK